MHFRRVVVALRNTAGERGGAGKPMGKDRERRAGDVRQNLSAGETQKPPRLESTLPFKAELSAGRVEGSSPS